MTHNNADTSHAHSTLNKMSKQRLPKHGGDTQTNAEEHTVPRPAVSICQIATETSECADDVCGRWTDDGGQNTTILIDGA